MGLSIVYTPAAKSTYRNIHQFITTNFGKSSAEKFSAKAEKTIRLIAEQPLMFKSSEIAENVRIGFITKQCALFYRVEKNEVQLLYFWDNRQEPIV
ncbi:type II toxin-antitoxin system RelE/ParE family toxin [Mucilaginibacter sp.]